MKLILNLLSILHPHSVIHNYYEFLIVNHFIQMKHIWILKVSSNTLTIQILVLWFQEWSSPSFYAVWSLAADAVHRLAALGGLGVPKDRNSYPWYLHKKWSLKNGLGFIMGWLRTCYSGLRWEEPGNSTEVGMSLVCSGNRVILIILGAKGEDTRPWLCRQEEVPHVLCFVILPCRFLASTLYSLEVCSQSCLTTVSSGSQSFRLSPHPCIACFVSFSFICGEKLEKHAPWNQNTGIQVLDMSFTCFEPFYKSQSVKWA